MQLSVSSALPYCVMGCGGQAYSSGALGPALDFTYSKNSLKYRKNKWMPGVPGPQMSGCLLWKPILGTSPPLAEKG
jgi:hypothetical protein